MNITYPAIVTEGTDGRWLVQFPDFGWGATDGASRSEALFEAIDLIDELIITTISEKQPLPEPTDRAGAESIAPTAMIAAKAALYSTARNKGINNSELARQLHRNERQIRTMLDPNASSKIQGIEAALAKMGKRLVISVVDDCPAT